MELVAFQSCRLEEPLLVYFTGPINFFLQNSSTSRQTLDLKLHEHS